MGFKISYILRGKHGVLRESLKKKGWTQRQAAEWLGMSPSAFGNIMNLRWVPKKLTRLQYEKLMELTGQSFDDLFPGEIRKPEFLKAQKVFERSAEVDPQLLLEQVNLLALPAPPDEILMHAEDEVELEKLLSDLDPKERMMLELRFLKQETSEKVGQRFGISGQRVRQICINAIENMRRKMN